MSMASVTSAFSDLPTPPYSQPEAYEALVSAMLQELYRITPSWVERKQRLQEVISFLQARVRCALTSFVVVQIKAQREAGLKIDSQAWRASWAS
jgi:hypothetical protein